MKIQKTDFSSLNNYYNFENRFELVKRELANSIKYVPMSGELDKKLREIKELIEEIDFI